MNRRRFLTGALGAGALTLGTPWLASARQPPPTTTSRSRISVLHRVLREGLLRRRRSRRSRDRRRTADALKRGRAAALQHAKALSDLLTGAGGRRPLPEDFEFEWPTDAFRHARRRGRDGARPCCRALLGAYQTAAAAATTLRIGCSTRASPRASSQQIGALAALAGRPESSRSPSPSTSRPRATRSRPTWVRRQR